MNYWNYSSRRKIKGYLLGSLLAGSFFFLGGPVLAESPSEQKNYTQAKYQLSVCQPASFRSHGKTAAQMAEEKRLAIAQAQKAEAARRAKSWPTAFVKVTDNMKKPNQVKIPFAQAPPISAKTRELKGRRVCAGSLKTGKSSKQDGKDVHIDKECCLDQDEIPNPLCYYPQLGANNSPERVMGRGGVKHIK